jgi:uncharacterized protein (DUF433 family)
VTSPVRRIKASVLVKDLEAGLNDYQVIQKHGLEPEQLEYLFHKMQQAGLVTRAQLEARSSLAETQITKAFVQVQQSMDELNDLDDSTVDEPATTESGKNSVNAATQSIYADALRALSDEGAPSSPAAPPRTTESTESQGKPVTDVYADALQAMAEQEPRSEPGPKASRKGGRTIRASDLVRDITSGMNDPQLMEKYQLQPKQLEFMLRKLVEAGRITETQLLERSHLTSTSITKAFVDVYQSLRELDEGEWDL